MPHQRKRMNCESKIVRANHPRDDAQSSTCTASASSSGGLFDGAPTVGDMNVITRGKNSRGEDYIFGSTSVGSEVCKFGPDAAEILTVECIPAAEYPREADAIEEVS